MPNYPYYPITPVASQPPRISPNNFNTNFGSIASLIGTDHYPFSDTTNGGWHKQSTYVDQTAPGPSCANKQVVVYSEQVTYPTTPTPTTFSELFFKRDTTATEVQITTGPGNPIAANRGVSYLPGGIIIQWGQDSAAPSPGTTVNFPVKFPRACFTVTITAYNTGSTARTISEVGTASLTGFTAITSSSSANLIYWIAIGN